MKHLIATLFIFTLITSPFALESHAAAVQLPKTGQTISYAAGDDGDLELGVAWPNPRFTDNGDQSVTDNLTGLIWAKDANLMKTRDPLLYGQTTYDGAGIPTTIPGNTWQQALDYVKKLNTEIYLGHNDWRLPNINELASIKNIGQSNQATWLNGQEFANVQFNAYWSTTNYTYDTSGDWVVSMNTGVTDGINKTSFYHVWPVRFGQSGAFGSLTLSKTGQTSCYNATGSTISCSGTGQDGESQTGVAWPILRFTDNSLNNSAEKTVTDNLTGLAWSKDADLAKTTKTWQQALDYVKAMNSFNFSGHNDWRLPNTNELASVLNQGQSNQATWLNGQGFANVRLNYYWSANTFVGNTIYAWVFNMNTGVMGADKKDNAGSSRVWPVRSERALLLKPGDCDNSGTVSIAEVQSGINMFLGLKAAEACVDQDGVGGVSIAEVQKVINSFLGL